MIVYITFISQNFNIYFFYKAQIVYLKVDKAFTFVLLNYANFVNIFFKKLITKLLNYIKTNNYTINLIKS